MLVFGGVAMIDEVAGHHRDIGQRVKPVDLSDRARQEFSGIDPAIEQLARRDDMRIGQLDNDHWLLRLLPLSPILCRQNAKRYVELPSPRIRALRCGSRVYPWLG